MAMFNDIIQSGTPVLVDFYANWCQPCKMMVPILQQVKGQLGDQVRIIKIDVDKNQEVASRYQIRSIPTTMIFQNGQMKWSGSGVMQADQLVSIIRSTTNR